MLTERLAHAKREALGAQLEAYGLAAHLLPAAQQGAALPAALDTQARPPCISPHLARSRCVPPVPLRRPISP